jgi:nucleoside 2-deoxyribosyltransferase
MNIFCAYAFTGEDLEIVMKRMRIVVDTLNGSGYEAYCNLDDEIVDAIKEKDDIRAIFDRVFDVLESQDALVAIVTSPNKSVGQIMEIGAAYSQKKPIYLFEHVSATGSTYLPKLATKTFTWESIEDLQEKLAQI